MHVNIKSTGRLSGTWRVSHVCVLVLKYEPELSSRQFGVELSRLTSEERQVPQLVEKLINYIEMHGLYTEGIYRKSGSANKIKELRQGLDTGENHAEQRQMGPVCVSIGVKADCLSDRILIFPHLHTLNLPFITASGRWMEVLTPKPFSSRCG